MSAMRFASLMRLLPAERRSLVTSAIAVGLVTLVVKAAGAGKELVVAYRLGTHPELGAFLFAYLFPAFLTNIIAASLQVALVPKYLQLQTRIGADGAAVFAARLTSATSIALIAATIVLTPLCVSLIPVLAHGFEPEPLRLCQAFVVLLMPSIVFTGVSSIWAGILNAHGHYRFAASVPLATPALVALSLVALWPLLGGYALVLGVLVGAVAEALFLGWRVSRDGLPLLARMRTVGPEERSVIAQFLPLAGGNLLMAASVLIEQTAAASISPASVAVYAYGTRLTTVTASILVVTLSTILLPYLSRLAAASGVSSVRRAVRPILVAVLFVAIPISLVLACGSDAITSVVFERGSFTLDDTGPVARIQTIHAMYIPVFAVGMVAVRMVNAIGKSKILFYGALCNLAVSLGLNMLLVPRLGLDGVAWANVGTYLSSALFLWGFLLRTFGQETSQIAT
jgi:putative peptidoglycan lipid II flippase